MEVHPFIRYPQFNINMTILVPVERARKSERARTREIERGCNKWVFGNQVASVAVGEVRRVTPEDT